MSGSCSATRGAADLSALAVRAGTAAQRREGLPSPGPGEDTRDVISTIAVGTDGSETAERAVAMAFDLAERYGARVVLLSAYRSTPASAARLTTRPSGDAHWGAADAVEAERILSFAEEAAALRGLTCTSDMADGDPGEVLVDLAERHGADVLVVGNRGMHRRVLGSVPNTVTHRASCSVFLVKTTDD
jgi:nucleotide-binding universal stress UspA family protein